MTFPYEHSLITITKRALWTMKIIILSAILIILMAGGYFYGEHRYKQARADFIEMYPVVQKQLTGDTFCFDRGEVIEAQYQGKGMFRKVR